MIIIICVDDCNGMMFHHRRQTQDRVLREDILRRAGGKNLWMNGYSFQQFAGLFAPYILVDEEFLAKAGEGDYCFVENETIRSYESRVEAIILYKWNRRYPADFYFDALILSDGWTMKESEDFPGYSHETITREVYVR